MGNYNLFLYIPIIELPIRLTALPYSPNKAQRSRLYLHTPADAPLLNPNSPTPYSPLSTRQRPACTT